MAGAQIGPKKLPVPPHGDQDGLEGSPDAQRAVGRNQVLKQGQHGTGNSGKTRCKTVDHRLVCGTLNPI